MRADDGDMLHAEVASVLDWWELAGVDLAVGEVPRDWLKPVARTAAPIVEAPPIAEPVVLPETLEAFTAWLARDGDADLLGAAAERVTPTGDAAARLMVLIDMPGPDDAVQGRLLAGDVGTMIDNMMKVVGERQESVWLASLFPARPPRGRADLQRLPALAEIARQHIGLKRPEKLLIMGQDVATALLGPGQHRGRFQSVATPGGPVSTVVTYSPHVLQATPAMKRAAWEDLKLLAGGEEP